MRVPIAYGLAFPERIESGATALDFATLGALSFEPADIKRFPGLALAWEVLRGADGSSAVLNAANEVAVAAFLAGTIRFDQIHSINARTLAALAAVPDECATAEGLLRLDARARAHAAHHVEGLAR
jgi:1-deoxy-D-xylulose-5-phosphate reductoisomerase